MISSPYEKYRQSSVQTSSPAQLLLMLFDGAVRFAKMAIDGIESADMDKMTVNFGKAQAIVRELTNTLDHSYEVSKGLATMYEYISYLFTEANLKKSKAQAEEAIGYLQDFRQTFAQAAKLAAGQNVQHG
ncbi:flagellar export chaperone FliS [Paenibacillus tepidiphilus]|uniref:flagellar export chaperone FliS n=1 Tax=Paenibacillus tepidiphilus TaxID=2608683 RepID=UPI00123A8C9C|nr:flagellar export chaperone FliS [Paenibacillus tepidiphilus]